MAMPQPVGACYDRVSVEEVMDANRWAVFGLLAVLALLSRHIYPGQVGAAPPGQTKQQTAALHGQPKEELKEPDHAPEGAAQPPGPTADDAAHNASQQPHPQADGTEREPQQPPGGYFVRLTNSTGLPFVGIVRRTMPGWLYGVPKVWGKVGPNADKQLHIHKSRGIFPGTGMKWKVSFVHVSGCDEWTDALDKELERARVNGEMARKALKDLSKLGGNVAAAGVSAALSPFSPFLAAHPIVGIGSGLSTVAAILRSPERIKEATAAVYSLKDALDAIFPGEASHHVKLKGTCKHRDSVQLIGIKGAGIGGWTDLEVSKQNQ